MKPLQENIIDVENHNIKKLLSETKVYLKMLRYEMNIDACLKIINFCKENGTDDLCQYIELYLSETETIQKIYTEKLKVIASLSLGYMIKYLHDAQNFKNKHSS